MNRLVRLSMALALVAFPCGRLLAEPNDERDVRQVVGGFAETWNHHDMEAFGKLFAPDADFVNVSAKWWKGREAIQMRTAYSHGTIPADTQGDAMPHYGDFKTSTMQFTQIDVRFLQKDVAVAHVSWELVGDARTPNNPRNGLFIFVLTRHDGSWLISAAQNTETTESRRQHECADQTNLNRTVK